MTLQVLQEIGFPLTWELAASVIQDYLKHEAIANPFKKHWKKEHSNLVEKTLEISSF